jgi:hypothetical protein
MIDAEEKERHPAKQIEEGMGWHSLVILTLYVGPTFG